MKVTVGNPVAGEEYWEKFVAEIDFMHGDEESFTVKEIVLGGFDGLHNLLGFAAEWEEVPWIVKCEICAEGDSELFGSPLFAKLFGPHAEFWPTDKVVEDSLAIFVGYDVFWYDENGAKYNVEIVEGDNG